MAGEYYRWLARNEKPEEKQELTPQEKRRNWWHYHKWYVIIGILCAVFVLDLAYDMVSSARNKPDYTIAYVGQTALPEDTVAALEQAFAALGEDLSGNGRVQAEVRCYQLQSQDPADQSGIHVNDAEMAYGASMLLMVNVETVENVIYLLEDPELFQQHYPILTRTDGSGMETDSGAPMWYRWSDCPVLAALELGTFRIPLAEQTVEGDSQEVMADIYVARRGVWGDVDGSAVDGALRLWERITEGAE